MSKKSFDEHGYIMPIPTKALKEFIEEANRQSKEFKHNFVATDPPQFMEPDYSFRFEELTPEQRDNFYKRKYKTTMSNLTKKDVQKISGIGFLALCGVAFVGGMLVRLLVTLAVWGYTLFGML